MLPSEMTSPADEARFGAKLTYLTIVWIVATVLVGILMVLIAPWLIGVY